MKQTNLVLGILIGLSSLVGVMAHADGGTSSTGPAVAVVSIRECGELATSANGSVVTYRILSNKRAGCVYTLGTNETLPAQTVKDLDYAIVLAGNVGQPAVICALGEADTESCGGHYTQIDEIDKTGN